MRGGYHGKPQTTIDPATGQMVRVHAPRHHARVDMEQRNDHFDGRPRVHDNFLHGDRLLEALRREHKPSEVLTVDLTRKP